MRWIWVLAAIWCGSATLAQDQTLADIRRDLTALNADIRALQQELTATGVERPQVQGSVLDRVNALEAALQRLTGQTEALEFRIQRIVRDGTNRIGDLEFRLVELEGGDVAALGQTSTLGGEPLASARPAAPQVTAPAGTQLAVGEELDFKTAEAALTAGNHAAAVQAFTRFREVYPGSPFEPRVLLGLGQALDAQGDTRSAARAWLDSYSGYPQSEVAAEALYRVGEALSRLGKSREACVTLAEVAARFPGDAFVARADEVRTALNCS